MDPNILDTSVAFLKGIGPNRAETLRKETGICTYGDLLNFFPNRYLDRTRFYKIGQLERNSAEVQIVGKIVHLRTVEQKRGKRLVADFVDSSGKMELIWFRGHKWIREQLKLNTTYVVFGRLTWYNGMFSMVHPEMEPAEAYKKGFRPLMQPVYPSTEGLSKAGITNRVVSRSLQQLIGEVKDRFFDPIPAAIIEELSLLPKGEALRHAHFPQNQELLARAQFRLKFEELFYIQVQLLKKNMTHKKKIKGYVFDAVGKKFTTFYEKHLPFDLTGAQKKVIREIRYDLGSGAQMNRLLQGDVGSGKTIVALMSILLAVDNGFQACLMAPTEILAQQHFTGISELVKGLGVQVSLLTGSTKASERRQLHDALEKGEIHLLIGTHALLEEKVQFRNLGFAIIDEQHRFGVAQRAKLWKKNELPPHILVMTATPIPRTLAMSLYGDLDISLIDELPPGRKQIKTVHRYDNNTLKVFRFIREEIKKGRQIYIVYPLIQESEKMDYKDLMDGYESIVREFPIPEFQISIVHGQMKPGDKDYEMDRFVRGETQIMVATTVIEVGVNVPNASVMIIESAERFGLSQLHQLRGRVGRGADQSYCILMTGQKLSSESRTRLETMVRTSDGFEIAEVDLKLRGPGDLMGTQQSGVLNLKIADIVRDNDILKLARAYAQKILKEDPDLVAPQNKVVKHVYSRLLRHKKIWNYIS